MSVIGSIGSVEERLEAERALLAARSITILARTDGDRLAWWRSVGVDPDLAASWAFVPLDPSFPVTEVVRSGDALFYETSADLLADHPRLATLPRPGGSATAFAPIRTGDVTVGVWVAHIAEPFAFTETRRNLIRALAADWAPHLADRASIATVTTIDDLMPEDIDTEAMLRALVGSAFDRLVGAVAVTSVDDRFLAVNEAACDLLGRSKDELKQLSFRDISHPDDGQADDRARAAVLGGADTVTVRKRFIRPDGTSVTVDVNLARLLSPTGRWMATLVQYTPVLPVDIVERTAEAVFDALPVGVAVFDLDQRFIAVNATLCAINGTTAEAHLGRTVSQVLPEPLGSDLSSILSDIVVTGEPVLDVLRSGTPAGEGPVMHTLCSWVPVRDPDGRIVATAALVVDRTAEHFATEAEQRRSATVNALVGSMPIPVTLLDRHGRYVHVNEATRQLAGVDPIDHLGRTVDEVYGPDIAAVVRELTADPPSVRWTMLDEAGGRQRHFRVTGFPVTDYGHGFAVLDRTDVTNARTRAEALAEIAGRLASTDRTADVAAAVEDVTARVLDAGVVITALFEQGHCRLLSVSGLPRATVDKWEHFPVDVDVPITRPHRTGRTDAWPDTAALRAAFPHAADDFTTAGVAAMVVLPLVVDDELIGSLGITWPRPCTIDDDEMQWLETLASILGQTLDRARRAERDRHAATVLQRSLLPDRLEPPPWLQAAACYRAAGDDSVGGDLYDLVPLPGGDVAVIVADVCGRGVEAAAGTAAVRHTLRAALLSGSGAADALAQVDVALRHVGSDELALATAVVAVVSPPTSTATGTDVSAVRVTTAGHPPVLVRHVDRSVSSIGGSSMLLGLDPTTALRPTLATSLRRGDVLVAYTDGLTDTPHPRLTDADVAVLTAEGPADPESVVAWLLGCSHADTPGDDTALIAVALR